MERFNFKTSYGIVLIIQIINAVFTPFILESDAEGFKKVWYCYSVIASSVAQGGHYIFFPVILAKLYGTHGGLLGYTVGFTFQAAGSLINTVFVMTLFESLEFKGISLIYAGFLVISLLILLFVYKGSEGIKKQLLRTQTTMGKSANFGDVPKFKTMKSDLISDSDIDHTIN